MIVGAMLPVPVQRTAKGSPKRTSKTNPDGSITITVADDDGNVIWSKTTAAGTSSAPPPQAGHAVNIIT